MTATHAKEDVLVIGAGPAGIASAYALEQAQLSYKVIDRAKIIGSTWDRLYPLLKLNTTRFYSHMPQKPFPLHYGIFPSGRQYHDYLLKFVSEHDFNIHLGIEVYRVAPQGPWWRVESSEGTYLYRAVISATGIFNHPIMPAIDGIHDFAGEVLHASEFKDMHQVTAKRVLVIGNGPSGIDIAVASGEVAASTHIAIRSGVQLKRRYPLGLPTHLWLLLADNLPDAWCRWLMSQLGSLTYANIERYGLWRPAPGEGGMTGYQGPELLNAVKAGKVQPITAPVQFRQSSILFADGCECAFDTVIMATGYQPVLHQYLDIEMQYNPDPWEKTSICDWETGPNGQRGWPLRDTSDHPNGRQILGHPGLYLVGVFYKGKGAMYNMNVEAQIAAQQIKAYLAQQQASLALAR